MSSTKEGKESIFSKSLSFLICTIIGLLFLIPYGLRGIEYYYDVAGYLDLSYCFGERTANGLNFHEFPPSIRGYSMPLVILLVRKFSSLIGLGEHYRYVFALMGVIVVAAFVAYVFPNVLCIAKDDSKDEYLKKVTGSCVVYLLIMIFWREFVFLPLTDLYAIICIMTGAVLLSGRRNEFLRWFLAGILLYFAYNLRCSYLLTTVSIIIVAVIKSISRYKIKGLMCGVASIIGGGAAALPQVLINYANTGLISAKVNYNLTLQILRGGILMSRYDTIVSGTEFPNWGSVDPVGKHVLEEYGFLNNIPSMSDYFTMVIHRPIQIMTVYLRHLVNMLDYRFGEVFVKHYRPTNYSFSIINYMIWFVAIVIIICLIKKERVNYWKIFENHIYLGIIIVFDCINLAAHMENRFFLPLYLIVYGCLGYDNRVIRDSVIVKKPFWAVCAFLTGLVVCLMVWTQSFIEIAPYCW